VACWGNNFRDALGLGDDAGNSLQAPALVPSLGGVVEVTAGRFTTCARAADGGVMCWGDNSNGQLGLAPDASLSRSSPVAVAGLGAAVQVETSIAMSCARLTGGEVRCWGANVGSQLGRGQDASALPLDPVPAPLKF
jgi:alpha-tubulin suppressor-like RCC1 family protein